MTGNFVRNFLYEKTNELLISSFVFICILTVVAIFISKHFKFDDFKLLLYNRLYPFQLYLTYLDKNYDFTGDTKYGLLGNRERCYQIFLLPDGLKYWFIIYSFLTFIGLAPFYYEHVNLLGVFITVLGIFLGVYWSIFHFQLKYMQVLKGVLYRTPSRNSWIVQNMQRIKLRESDYKTLDGNYPADRLLLMACTAPKAKKYRTYKPNRNTQNAYLYTTGTTQHILLNLAIIDFFKKDGNLQTDSGWLRFGVVWYAPVWISFLIIFFPLFYQYLMVSFDILKLNTTPQPGYLAFALLLWMIASLVFTWQQFEFLGSRSFQSINIEDEDRLPVRFNRDWQELLLFPEQEMGHIKFSSATWMIVFIAFTVYGFLLTLIATLLPLLKA